MLSTSTIPSTIETHNGCIVPYEAETFAPYISGVRAVPFKAETPDLHYGDTSVVKRLSPLYGSAEPFPPCNLSPHRAPSVTGIPPM